MLCTRCNQRLYLFNSRKRHYTNHANKTSSCSFFQERNGTQRDVRFEDVVFHHAEDATFMTYRVTGTDIATNETFERVGVERYTFKNGRIAEKDVYSRPK